MTATARGKGARWLRMASVVSGWLERRGASLLVALAYVAWIGWFGSYRSVFEFDPDEGNNLIKALLLERGHEFFTEIWSDQPPLMAYVLLVAFKALGWEVSVARMVVVLFAGAGLFAVYDSLRVTRGHLAALAGAVLLVTSTQFVQLSMSVMIGLPAISLMLLGVWALVNHLEGPKLGWLAASGAFMGLSVATKLFTAYLLPAYGFVVVAWAVADTRGAGGGRPVQRALVSGCTWGGGLLVASLLGLAPVLAAWNLGGLVEAHELARESRADVAPGLGVLLGFLREDGLLFGLALLGTARAVLARAVDVLVWALWCALSLLVLQDHFPVWPHHRLLVTVPAAVVAGYAAGAVLTGLERGRSSGAFARWRVAGAAVGIVMAGALSVLAHPVGVRGLARPRPWANSQEDAKVMKVIERYVDRSDYILSARQMYAFRAGVAVPPNLAVTSYKRMRAGLLDEAVLREAFAKYQPKVVVLSNRWSGALRRAAKSEMGNRYTRRYSERKYQSVEVYVRNDVQARKEPIEPSRD